MALTPEETAHIGRLAALELTAEECARFAHELTIILDYVAKLGELSLNDVAPMSHVGERGTPLRADAVASPQDADRVLAAAPTRSGRFVQVPKVIG